MRDFEQRVEYLLDRVWFRCFGNSYNGRGILTWNPKDGYHLEVLLEKNIKATASSHASTSFHIVERKDAPSIRMAINHQGHAIAKHFLPDDAELLAHARLSCDLKDVIFVRNTGTRKSSQWLSGKVLYLTAGGVMFPDVVSHEVKINSHTLESGNRTSGLDVSDDRQEILGRMLDTTQFEVCWHLSKAHFSKTESWRWPLAAQSALSMLLGQTVWLLRREVWRPPMEYVQQRAPREAKKLTFYMCPFAEQIPLHKDVFLALTESFTRDESKWRLCRSIFAQIRDASNQDTMQGQELLLSTILEAVLRTLDGLPFQPGDYSWKVVASMERFRTKFLSDKWKAVCDDVLDVRKRLRHRNAHPDWLTNQHGGKSKEGMLEAINDMRFLSRFYGYMIKAIAGLPVSDPVFPSALSQPPGNHHEP